MIKDRIVVADKSIIIAMDTEDNRHFLHASMASRRGIGAAKFGISLGLEGLKKNIEIFRSVVCPENVPVIYDHQKAGNDIPDIGKVFAKKLKEAGVDAAILFPFTGPVTQETWTKTCQDAGLEVIIGGIMTHSKFLRGEEGYIADDTPLRIYELGVVNGVRHFVVPGNKPEWIAKIRQKLDDKLGIGNYVLYAPGFVKQGGSIEVCDRIAGPNWHAIVGRDIIGTPEEPHLLEEMQEKIQSLNDQFKLAA